MPKLSYAELLQDVRWRARRDQIIMAADNTCAECGGWFVEPRMNVHHRHYRAGAMPWEYEDADLVCLCRACHEVMTDELERVYRVVGRLPIAALSRVVAFAEQLQTVPLPLRLPAQAGEEDAA